MEFVKGDYTVRPLDHLSVTVKAGSLALLLGPSGCGKTTLLSCLAAILRPSSGTITSGDTDITALSGHALTRYRRHGVGEVFQAFNLVPSLTSVENVALPMRSAGVKHQEACGRSSCRRTTRRPGNWRWPLVRNASGKAIRATSPTSSSRRSAADGERTSPALTSARLVGVTTGPPTRAAPTTIGLDGVVTEGTVALAPLACAYGGGGLFGIAYLLGVGEALTDRGVRLGAAPAIGTSAGSWAAAALALGVRWNDAIDAIGDDVPRVPDPRSGRLRRVAAEVFDDQRVPTMRAVVCSLPRLQRVVLHGTDHPVADLVAASSAVPGMLAPHRVGRHRYVDGGVRSMASADLADPAEHLLVMAPIAGPMFGPAGRLAERVLRREMRDWRQRNPDGHLWLIRPNRAIAELAGRPDQLFDPDRARRAYDLAYGQADGILSRWNDAYGDRSAA